MPGYGIRHNIYQRLEEEKIIIGWLCCLVFKSCLTLVNPWNIARQPRWNSPGKNTRMGCHFLLQGIFQTQGSNPGLLHWQASFTTEPRGTWLDKTQKRKYLQLGLIQSWDFNTQNRQGSIHTLFMYPLFPRGFALQVADPICLHKCYLWTPN